MQYFEPSHTLTLFIRSRTPLCSSFPNMRISPIGIAAVLIALACLPLVTEAAMRNDDGFQPPEPSDVLDEITELSASHRHARHVEHYLMLPEHYITRVDPPSINLFYRALIHLNSPEARFMLHLSPCLEARQCLMISPYRLEQMDRDGRRTKEKVIMMLVAERNKEIEPVGLLHLPRVDQLGVWDWVNQMAMETKQSLQSRLPGGRFVFPEIIDM